MNSEIYQQTTVFYHKQAAWAAFEMQYAEKITSGKNLNIDFLRQLSQDDIKVSLFNTPKLAHGVLLGACCFWIFLFLL